MSNYQAFPITEFKTGINTYLQPWRRPIDAFEPLTNAYVYRGIISKRRGYSQYGNTLADNNPVMGIMQYINETTGAISLIVASTQNLYAYSAGSNTFVPITLINNSQFWTGAVTAATTAIPSSGTIPTFWPNLVKSTSSPTVPILITAYNLSTSPPTIVGTITDNGTILTGGTGIFTGNGTINYTTGVVSFPSVTIASSYNLGLQINATTSNYFTGNISNFFNWTNWQASDGALSFLYMVNNKDPITTVTLVGSTWYLARQVLYVDSIGTYISTALDVNVYKNRLLAIRPILNPGGIQAQGIYWSAVSNPQNFLVTLSGNGGFELAPTGDIIQSDQFLRDILVVFFTNTTWVFRFTGDDFAPFRWDKVNSSKNTSCPYASVPYDERVTSIGSSGLIACDGVNVQRYDLQIIDYYQTQLSEQYYAQAYSKRYDNLNQTWTLFVSNQASPTQFPVVGGVAPGSDSVLVYNFLENTWATYTFQIPMTCMGIFYQQMGTTWAQLTQSWESTDSSWSSYFNQKAAPILLMGDTDGHVWLMDNVNEVTDKQIISTVTSQVPIVPLILSTRWNPMIEAGQKLQFGYIDIYYLVASVDPANPISVTLNFYADNSSEIVASRPLTLDGPESTVVEQTISTGNGGAFYSGTLHPSGYIIPFTVSITVLTSQGMESFEDNGNGALIGSLVDTGTINYKTGHWMFMMIGRTVANGNKIIANYQYNNTSSYNFKRIYINIIAQFVQMEIDPDVNAYMEFVGFIIWAKPSGRLTSP
jgi:hypothetical protein